VNCHSSEVQNSFAPEEGNAFHNAITYGPSPAACAPVAAPKYYALMLYARFAQDTRVSRPVDISPAAVAIKA
jgi:hypothetical protein